MKFLKNIVNMGVVSLSLFLSQHALCHSIMTSSAPEKDASISVPVTEISVCFNESIGDKFMSLVVVDKSGERVDKGAINIVEKDNEICLQKSLVLLAKGLYLVRYRAQSDDGHVVSGKYSFDLMDSALKGGM